MYLRAITACVRGVFCGLFASDVIWFETSRLFVVFRRKHSRNSKK